jgi:uncharacterized membrane protein HdeD (DUF308 family)
MVLDSHLGMLLGYMGILSSLVQGGYVRRVKDSSKLVHQGILSCAFGVLVLSTAQDKFMLYLGCGALAFTSGTVVNGLTALEAGDESEERGKK